MRRLNILNLVALFGQQAANAAIPLLIFPHLLLIAGPERFSHALLAEAIALLVLMAALYSFDVSAVSRVVGLTPEVDAEAISKEFSGVLGVRLLILVPASVLAWASCRVWHPELLPYLGWWLLLPLSQVLQSAWLFQGLERSLPAAWSMLGSRGAAVVLIFVAVRRPEQAPWAPAILGCCALAGSLGLLAYLHVSWRVRIRRVPRGDLRELFRGGGTIFLGNSSVCLYRDVNVMILDGVGAGSLAVAAYGLAEKLIKGLQSLSRPLNQAFFPLIVRTLRGERVPHVGLLQRILRLTAPQLGILLAIVVLLGGAWAVGADRLPLFRKISDREQIQGLLATMLPAVFFGVMNFTLGVVGLNHLSAQRFLFLALLAVGVSNVVLCAALGKVLAGQGAALAFAVSEALLCCLIVSRYLRRAVGQAAPAAGR